MNRGSPSMVNMLRIPKLSTVSTVLKMGCTGVHLGFTCNCVVNIYYIFDAVSRNVIIPTNNLLIRAVYKIKADSSGWPNLQVSRSGLVRACILFLYVFEI